MKPTSEQLDEQDCTLPRAPESVGITLPPWLAERVAKARAERLAKKSARTDETAH